MTDMRTRRLKALADLIRNAPVASQEQATARLKAQGFDVTQATVSRDLDQLGAIKVKRGGVLAYTLPDQLSDGDWAAARLDRVLKEWVLSMEAAGQLIVVRTPPGSAHLVGAAIDGARVPEIAGTVSGDDTLFIAVRDGVMVHALLARFRALAGETKDTFA